MQIVQIFKKNYPDNKKISIEYTSDYYYKLKKDIKPNNDGWVFEWKKLPFRNTFRKKWEGNLFESYKEETEYYVLYDPEKFEVGVLAFGHQTHSNRTRIWDIIVYSEFQRMGYGTFLMNFAYKKARKRGSRALILECQNTNVKAINFYLKNGFNLIGFDIEAYTLEQGGGIEVRFEMSKNLSL